MDIKLNYNVILTIKTIDSFYSDLPASQLWLGSVVVKTPTRNNVLEDNMDLSIKTAKVKQEYIEENTDFLTKDVPEPNPLTVLPMLPHRNVMEFSPLIHHPQLFQPFPPPFYHQMPSFNLATLPPPALRDFFDPNPENHKRKSSLKIHESNNKKIRDRDRADIGSIQPLPPNQEKETKPSDESSSGK